MTSKQGLRCMVLGHGFIGTPLTAALQAQGHSLTVLDRGPKPPFLPASVHWIKASYTDFHSYKSALEGTDVVYYLVGSTVPLDSHVNLVSELYENVIQTIKTIELCKAQGVKKIVFASSASVYGNQVTERVDEEAATNPISAHGIQKLTLEKHLRMERSLERLDTQSFRIANPYGPGQDPNGRQGFIAIALGCLMHSKPLGLRGNGSAQRDFIHIDDVVEALVQIGLKPHGPACVNIGSGEATELGDLVDLIESIGNRPLTRDHLPAHRHEIHRNCLDITLAQNLGWSPKIDLRAGLSQVMTHHGLI